MIPDPGKPYQTLEAFVVTPNSWKAHKSIEIREYPDGVKVVFVFTRGNSRPFDTPLIRFMDLMRLKGMEVVVEISGVEVTLEQFERTGRYSVLPSRTASQPQGRYNIATNTKRLEEELASMKEDDPRYYFTLQQISRARGILASAKPPEPVLDESTQKSREGLDNLAELIQRDAFDAFLKIPDEELATYDFFKLEKLGILKTTKQWSAVLARWNNVRPKETTPNAS